MILILLLDLIKRQAVQNCIHLKLIVLSFNCLCLVLVTPSAAFTFSDYERDLTTQSDLHELHRIMASNRWIPVNRHQQQPPIFIQQQHQAQPHHQAAQIQHAQHGNHQQRHLMISEIPPQVAAANRNFSSVQLRGRLEPVQAASPTNNASRVGATSDQLAPAASGRLTLKSERPCNAGGGGGKLAGLLQAAASSEQLKRTPNTQDKQTSNSTSSSNDQTEDEDEDDQDDEQNEAATGSAPGELMASRESVAHESSLAPPPPMMYGGGGGDGESLNEEQSQANSSGGEEANGSEEQQAGGQDETPPDEAAERREQEAAEASEAEAANRSALAEQQQAQREIILAQAQSEAKAIREQQEALLKQQQMQQQILEQRHQSLLDADAKQEQRGGNGGGESPARASKQRPKFRQNYNDNDHQSTLENRRNDDDLADERARQEQRQQQLYARKQMRLQRQQQQQAGARERMLRLMDTSQQHQFAPIDNQFSDQLENGIVDRGMEAASSSAQLRQQLRRDKNFDHAQQRQRASQAAQLQQQADNNAGQEDEMGTDYSMRQALHSGIDGFNSSLAAWPQLTKGLNQTAVGFVPLPVAEISLPMGLRLNLTEDDLLVAAAQHQHNYGAHYGSLGGHHTGGGHYYQFAESHKKGQFDSGFKRGNKKFSISGHSSQHKGHAKGHIKWHSKKGKGTHYWDLKHKNKKHYGSGDSYGGGHHHY